MMAVSTRRGPTRRGAKVGHVVDIQTEEYRDDQSTLSYPSPHASTSLRGRLERRFERAIPEIG